MNLKNKYMVFCAIIFTLSPVILSTFTSDEITATDWTYRHSVWIEQYLHKDFTPILQYYPMFHFIMLPFVFIGFPMRFFQIIFAVLSLFGVLYMTKRLEGDKSLFFVAIMSACSIAFVEFSSALMPQALDYFLFPMAVVFYSSKRVKTAMILCLSIFLMHGTGFIFFGIFLVHSLLTRRFKRALGILLVIIALSPVFYYYNFGAPTENFINIWDAEAQAEWERQYIEPFYNFFFFSGFMTWILLLPASKKLIDRKFKLTDNQLLYIVWTAMFLPFIPFKMGIWRMISYQIVPLSLLVASILGSDENGDAIRQEGDEKRISEAMENRQKGKSRPDGK